MSYISKNEPDKFRYDDCVIEEVNMRDGSLCLSVEALIVKADNSQNSNYTESYAGTAQMAFDDATIIKAVKEGYKRYDANDKLLEEVEDESIPVDELDLNDFVHQYLCTLRKITEGQYLLEIEFADEDPSAITDVYELTLTAGDFNVTWDKYLNKVQN